MFNKLKQLLNSKKELPWFKYYGKMPKRLKYFEGSLYEYMENTAVKYPNNCALEFFNKKMTYKRLLEEIDELALSLSNDGIKENDIVTICMANSPEAVVAFYAINKIGAISNIIHPLSSENEIKDIEPVSNATKLNYIAMENNQVKDIRPLKTLTNLEYINLIGNPVENETEQLVELKKEIPSLS